MKVIYITTTGDNTLELPTPLDVEGYLCGIVELAGKSRKSSQSERGLIFML